MNGTCALLVIGLFISVVSQDTTPPAEAPSTAQASEPVAEGLQGVLPVTAPDLLTGLTLLANEAAAASESPDWRADVATAQAALARLYEVTGLDSNEPLSAQAQRELLNQLRATQFRIRDAAGEIQGEIAAELRQFRYRLWRRRKLLKASFEALEVLPESVEEKLAESRQQLRDHHAVLKQSLGSSPNGQGWMRYLRLAEVEALVAHPDTLPTPDAVAALADRLGRRLGVHVRRRRRA